MTITRISEEFVLRDVVSSQDARRRVDQHFAEYACPPDLLNPQPHTWLACFETRRGARFTPPKVFKDKEQARDFAADLLLRRSYALG